MKRAPQSADIVLRELFKLAKKVKPKLRLTAAQREERALRLLGDGKVTFSKAAEIAGLDVFSFAELVKSSQAAWVGMRPDELRKELRG